jgi:hypothetical protein
MLGCLFITKNSSFIIAINNSINPMNSSNSTNPNNPVMTYEDVTPKTLEEAL